MTLLIPEPETGATEVSTQEFDSVTEDAIKAQAPIPPAGLPEDQRRAYLGGIFGFRAGRAENPYRDPGCARSWDEGYERARRGEIRGV